ncbi:hypothetical protein [Rubrobacter calidifluminis]|uniref:hypothetical protein n=1 Tax=Rubrobacter calidifluminis TaxID=1392640 RepID=UPI00235ECAD5|nr:hypothetical protein [Rubrobacter calidifluminis]
MGELEVRWSQPEDRARIADLLEVEDLPRWLAWREQFLVAERGGEIVGALEYRMAHGQIVLGIMASDLFVDERAVARALYSEALAMAWVVGARQVRALPTMRGDYPAEAGYRKWNRVWRGGPVRPPRHDGSHGREGGLVRRVLYLLGRSPSAEGCEAG